MTATGIVLTLAALPIGLTGAWSPCGFSMVETIGLRGQKDRRRTLAACATFAPGAVLGGVLTFGLLGALGEAVHGAGGTAAYAAAAAIALVAALLEARGVRIVPQIRRQLPEEWRWSLPLPLAAGLYGILLGLGFTTFVLSFGVWALAAISFALGDPLTGAAIGLSFGVGRAIPVVVLAPLADHRLGIRATELMTESPLLYRRARLGDGLALALAALTLTLGSQASAAHVQVRAGADPSAAGGDLAYQRPNLRAALLRGGHSLRLPGSEPAAGGSRIAVLSHGRIVLLHRQSLDRIDRVSAKGVDSMAVSDSWLVYVQSSHGQDVLKARRLAPHGRPGAARVIRRIDHPARIGHPSLDGKAVAYGLARPRHSKIVVEHLATGGSHIAVTARRAQLSSPSIRNGHLVYVRAVRERQNPIATTVPRLDQDLVLSDISGRHPRSLYRVRGHRQRLWSTALAAGRAYVTLLEGNRERVLRINR